MRFGSFTAIAAILMASLVAAQTSDMGADCQNCLIKSISSNPNCKGVNFSPVGGQPSANQAQCACSLIASTGWIDSCKDKCSAQFVDSLKAGFATSLGTDYCKDVSFKSAAPSMAPKAGAALVIAGAAVVALF
ncbi:hypothetical protein BGW38_001540 [Lunasporangiospora selenospora]|uniref:Extracellular membrane protein CFEM domain-containing protein n=1 Tax=Lunasporangiospora selenospora TaxID=979761 RepID=A0A9P6FVF9_9FUNG|nr:hypothetical protein BGW38_001540 [Lunasporangiospora selenospora]